MSDKKKDTYTEDEPQAAHRRPGQDWRLTAETELVCDPLAQTGKVLGWIGLLALVVALLWYSVTKAYNVGPIVTTVLGAAGVVFWVVTNRTVIGASFKARGARNFANSMVFVVFVLGILTMVNIIGARHHWRHDLTKDKSFSLSEQTDKILDSLDKDVQMVAFLAPGGPNQEIRDRVHEYGIRSRRVKIEEYDPTLNVQKRQEFNIQFDGTVVVKCGDKKEDVTGGSEEQLTSAILSVTKGEKTKVYFLAGHGEKAFDKPGEDSVAELKGNLENQQYAVEGLTLATQAEPAVPADCACLVVIGPKQKLLPKEKDAIKKYVDQGGKLFLALDPGNGEKFEEILGARDVTPINGTVIDPTASLFRQAAIPMVNNPKDHKITENFQMVALPLTMAFDVKQAQPPPSYPGAPAPPAGKATALLESSPNSWLTQTTSGKVEKQATDRNGPLVMAVAINDSPEKPPTPPGMPKAPEDEKAGPSARIVVVGSSMFVTDKMVQLGLYGNVVFALKSIAWDTENEKLISIPPKEKQQKTITMNAVQTKMVIILVLLIVPGGIIAAWISVWWIRRRR